MRSHKRGSAPSRIQPSVGTRCPTGKRGYEHRRDARAHRDQLRQQRERVNIYRCPQCGLFHVGHLPAWRQQGFDHDPSNVRVIR
jgi:predicted RNA-binding Zn-ribbon protein involved in translation (DUF1610 family)